MKPDRYPERTENVPGRIIFILMLYSDQTLIELTFHSTTIEGSTISMPETVNLLNHGTIPAAKPLEHCRMVRDHHTALQFTIKKAAEKSHLTIPLLQTIAGLVLKNTGTVYHTALGNVDSSRGEFRKGNVSASGVYFLNYDKVEGYTRRLIKSLEEKMTTNMAPAEALDLSYWAHQQLVNIHPFYDGNGRAARLLMNYIQAFYEQPLVLIRFNTRDQYIAALVNSRKQEDPEIFLSFMRKCHYQG